MSLLHGWEDVNPIKAPENHLKVLNISYSHEYDEKMSLFRAVLESQELSERSLALATEIINIEPANITAWWMRMNIIEKVGFNADDEIDFTNRVLFKKPKVYQAWVYRMKILEKNQGNVIDETNFFKRIIAIDEKNFHAWSYFCWYAEKFDKGQWLFDLTTPIIQHTLTNNSAWNARMRALRACKMQPSDDLDFCTGYFQISPTCETICSYIRGLYKIDNTIEPQIREAINFLIRNGHKTFSVLALSLFIEEQAGNTEAYNSLCDELAEKDPLRKTFWNFMKKQNDKYSHV